MIRKLKNVLWLGVLAIVVSVFWAKCSQPDTAARTPPPMAENVLEAFNEPTADLRMKYEIRANRFWNVHQCSDDPDGSAGILQSAQKVLSPVPGGYQLSVECVLAGEGKVSSALEGMLSYKQEPASSPEGPYSRIWIQPKPNSGDRLPAWAVSSYFVGEAQISGFLPDSVVIPKGTP